MKLLTPLILLSVVTFSAPARAQSDWNMLSDLQKQEQEQSNRASKYIGDMNDALMDVGHVEPYRDCHHITIRIDGGWGYGKLLTGTETESDGGIGFTYGVILNNTASLSFDLADIDDDKTKLHGIWDMDQDVTRLFRAEGKGMEGSQRNKEVLFFTHGINGFTITSIDLKNFPTVRSGDLTWEQLMDQLGATVRHIDMADIWFKNVPHQEAFKKALESAAIVCRTQP